MNKYWQPTSRLRRLSMLLFGLLILLFGSGCGTMSIITEVLRDDEGNHSAVVTFNTQIDAGVAAAAKLDRDGVTEIPEGLHRAWTYRGDPNTFTLSYRREFATLGDLALLPGELRTLATDVSLDIVNGITVTVGADADGRDVYTYTANLYIPPPGELSGNENTCDPNTESIGEWLACAVQYDIDGDPALKAALDKAGDPKLVFEVILPGYIDTTLANNVAQGFKMDEGRAVWELELLRENHYELRAISHDTPRADSAEERLEEALSGDVGFEGLMHMAGVSQERRNDATSATFSFSQQLRRKFPADMSSDVESQILSPFTRASMLATMQDDKGKPLFPVFRAMEPIIAHMALNAIEDEEARRALGRLVELLIAMEHERITTPEQTPS